MKDSYPENMLCFLQGFGDSNGYKSHDVVDGSNIDGNKKLQGKRVSLTKRTEGESQIAVRKRGLISGKTLRLSSVEQLTEASEVKRSLSDRFSVINNGNSKKTTRRLLTIRKTWSTGNFPSGAAGGGCGAPRSAPATPLQLEPHPRTKHDKQVLKPLSGSAPSVRAPALTGGGETEGKPPSKSRQKKFQRHFPQVGPEERVLNYYSCALVGDLLLQGHLYITKNYFAFYSNVFGYVTKLLIPTTSVLRITKEKVARIIPNAVGVCTRDERHVFGSLLSRDSTYKLMTHVWKAARGPELAQPKPQDLRASEVELDASEYSPEDDSSSGGAERRDVIAAPVRRDSEAIIAAGAAVIQPALLTGAGTRRTQPRWRLLALGCSLLLACSAALMLYRLCWVLAQPQADLSTLSGHALQSELSRWRSALHGRAAAELHAFLSTNLMLLTKVRQSLEALSGVILTDMAAGAPADIPSDTVFS